MLLATYALHKEMLFASFDQTGASVVGLPTDKLEYALLALLAIVIVLALQAVGIVLVISMLITPAATALLIVRNFQHAMGPSRRIRGGRCCRRPLHLVPLQPALRAGHGTGGGRLLHPSRHLEPTPL